MRATNLGLGLGLQPKMKGGMSSTPVNPLRAIATQSRVATGAESRGKTGVMSRYPFVLGATALTMAVLLNNWTQGTTGDALPGNAVLIEDMVVETSGGAYAPVTFGGSRSKLLANGDFDVVSDELLPSALGLIAFNKLDQFWIKCKVSVATAGQSVPYTPVQVSSFAGSQGFWYDPLLTAVSSTDASGVFTYTGTAPEPRPSTFCPMIIGRPVVDGTSFIVIGDSIAESAGDNGAASGIHGLGFIQRSMHLAGVSGAAIYPCMNCSKFGATVILNETRRLALYKYAKYCIDEVGTNDIGIAGGGDLAVIKPRILSHWAEMRARGIQKIIRTTLTPRATSTDSWRTIENQTIATNWGVGGKGEDLNNWFTARQADGTIDHVAYMNSIRAPEDFWKFKVNGSANYTAADSTHPAPQGHEFMAEDLRPVLALL